MNLAFQTGASYGMLLSILIPNLTLAISLIPVLIAPFVLMSGFFVNTNNLLWVFKPIEYLSIFKYTYQATYTNEMQDLPPFHCTHPCNPLAEAGFNESLTDNFFILAGLAVLYRLLSYVSLRVLSRPAKCRLSPVE